MKNKGNDNLNAIRMLGIQAINKANSGHPGIVLGAAPMMYSLFVDNMNYNSKKSNWFNRDRFVLSAGHGSALLYATLHLTGFKIKIEDLKQFRQFESITPGHPESTLTDGVEVTTGPLGQGIGMGVGMALAESFLAAKYNKPKFKIIDHYTFVLCGDGDLQEGVSQETISFAGRNRLNKLILLHDSNDVQLDDYVSKAQVEDMQGRFKASGWNSILVKDGENIDEINAAISQAKKSDRPTYIEVKTIIGIGATLQGTSAVHGNPLGNDLPTVTKQFAWDYEEFTIPQKTKDFYKKVVAKGVIKSDKWDKLLVEYTTAYPSEIKELKAAIRGNWKINDKEILSLNKGKTLATRVTSGMIFDTLMKSNPTMFGGSADLSSSTKIKGADGNYDFNHKTGRNIAYGVREFGMGTINNGMAAHGGILPVASGFFVFTDYIKPAMRLASIMNLQELFIYTHDSVAVGEDGPTHQPIEQLAMIRTIPNHNVIRPADFAETYAAYKIALETKTMPTTLVLTRQDVKELEHKNNVVEEVRKGAYTISDAIAPKITLIATGSEVGLAIEIKQLLTENGIGTRVVSMPSMNMFDQQEQKYKDLVIDKKTFRVSIEMGTTYGWAKYTGDNGINFGIDTFGESAPGSRVIEKFGFTAKNIYEEIMRKYK